jgi:hypothetical protein
MLAWGKTGPVRARATAGSAGSRAADIYHRCAVGLYKQALLTLGDSALAGDVAGGVIADECTLPPASSSGEDEARYRLAQPVFRRYRQLAADPAWPGRCPAQRPSQGLADGNDSSGPLSEDRREALGLALSGGLGYVRASRALGAYPRDMAALLHTVLRRLASSSATSAARGLLRDEGHRCRACDSGPAEDGGK